MQTINTVRVRFAPSPTGYLHIGGLRTALFNFLFARHNNGKFILRIEDTDQTRKVEGAVENLIHILRLMGLDYDEGPDKGGEYGPYFQSQRLEIYKKYVMQLLEQGDAYYAFETPEELEEMRRVQQIQGLQTMYNRRARNLSSKQIQEKLNSGIPYIIRLRVPLDTEIKFADLIRGNVKIETNLIDDQVLMKSDGYPTYHLANVVDDHLMGITYVIRGEEWLTSVPKHILIYKALGWEIPLLAHVPLILNPDKTKLSKRQGDVATEDFIKKGYLPEALINFIALLGWNPGEGENKEIFSLNELIELFSIEKINSSGAVFNLGKLNWMNKEYLQMKAREDPEEFYHLSKSYLDSDKSKLITITPSITATAAMYISTLKEIPNVLFKYYPSNVTLNEEQRNILKTGSSQKVINTLISGLSNIADDKLKNMKADDFKNLIKDVQKETGVKGKELFHPIRLVLNGQEHGPELGVLLHDYLDSLGKEGLVTRLKKIYFSLFDMRVEG
jgi:glutamyl-tRNA synthetase